MIYEHSSHHHNDEYYDHNTDYEHNGEHVCSSTCDHHHASQYIDTMQETASHHDHENEHNHIHGPDCGHVEYQHAHHHVDRCEEHGHTEHCSHKDHRHAHTEIDVPHVHNEKCGHLGYTEVAEIIDLTHDNDVQRDEPIPVAPEPSSRQTESATHSEDSLQEAPRLKLPKIEEIKQPIETGQDTTQGIVQSENVVQKADETTKADVTPASIPDVLSNSKQRPTALNERATLKIRKNQLELPFKSNNIEQKLETSEAFQQIIKNETHTKLIEEVAPVEQLIMPVYTKESDTSESEELDTTQVESLETSDILIEPDSSSINATNETLKLISVDYAAEEPSYTIIEDMESEVEFSPLLSIDGIPEHKFEYEPQQAIRGVMPGSAEAVDILEHQDTSLPAAVEISNESSEDALLETHASIAQEAGEFRALELFETDEEAETFFGAAQTAPQKHISESSSFIDVISEINSIPEDDSEQSLDHIGTHRQGALAQLFVSSAKDTEHITTRIGQVVLELLKLKQKQTI